MAELQLPLSVRVLGQDYTIEYISRDDAMFRGADHEAVGSTDLNLQRIRVRGPEELSPAQTVDTLVHEVLHAIFYQFGLRGYLANHEDEGLIGVLASALVHTMRDNVFLVAAIMGDHDRPTHGEALPHDHTD